MVDDTFFDGFLTGGYLPGLRAVTVLSADGASTFTLQARQEPITEQQLRLSGLEAVGELAVYFIPVDQTGYVRPRSRWKITDSKDDSVWVVDKDDLTIQARGVAVVCTRFRG